MTDSRTRAYENETENEEKKSQTNDVTKLFSKKYNDDAALAELKYKYGKDNKKIYEIYDKFKEMKTQMVARASKFKDIILNRYNGTLSFPDLVKKAKKYAKKYKISDDVFQYFMHLITTTGMNDTVTTNLPNTSISKTLGYGQTGISHIEKLNIKDSELGVLQEILKLYGQTKVLHSQVVLQTLGYKDNAPEAIAGTLGGHKDHPNSLASGKLNFYSFIHPVLAALFLPKFEIIDEHILLANMGYIIHCKYNKTVINTKPDYNLYWDMITDHNDNVCDIDSAITDIKNRYILQTKIWNCVLNLRQGQYYHWSNSDFLLSVESCRSNIYDAPDLTYVKDEGTILRKILTAFSIRPTIVSTSRLYNYTSMAPYDVNPGFMGAAGLMKISTISMITMRIPFKKLPGIEALSLEYSMNQPQLFVENKMLVPKTQSVLYSKEIIIFYINRRFKSLSVADINSKFNFMSLPHFISGIEKLNSFPVNYDPIMNILGDDYTLRSTVFVNVSYDNPKLKDYILGSTAGIIVYDQPEDIYGKAHLLYDPMGSANIFKSPITGKYVRNQPITEIHGEPQIGAADDYSGESFSERATTKGTIFIYKKNGPNYANPYVTL